MGITRELYKALAPKVCQNSKMLSHDTDVKPQQAVGPFSNVYTETGGVGDTLPSLATILSPSCSRCWCFVVS